MAPPASVEELWTMAQRGSMPPLEQMKAYALREVVQSLDVHIPNSREGKSLTNGKLIGCKYTRETAQCTAPNAMQFEVGSWHAFTIWGRCCLTVL